MSIKNKGGLTYSLGGIDDGHRANVDMMGSHDPATRAAARLNRDLVNVLDNFLNVERATRADPVNTMTACMHGVLTVCGSLLTNMPARNRRKASDLMRKQMNEMFDTMDKIVVARKAKP